MARLVVIAAAVALGVGLLLATLAGVNAVNAQNARYAWLNSGTPAATAPDAVPSPDPLWGSLTTDHFAGRSLIRVDVAATGPDSPVPPGLPRLPGPGEYYASPALADAAAVGARPTSSADRYPGRQVGTIGDAALPSPGLADRRRRPHRRRAVPHGRRRRRSPTIADPLARRLPRTAAIGTNANGIDLILGVVAVALLFPVLIFIGTATRLSAARREQRFAAMRLVGATPRQISVIAAVESTVAAVAGTVVGFGLFSALRAPLRTDPVHRRAVLPRRPLSDGGRRARRRRSACRWPPRSRPGSRCAGCASPRSA